MPTIAIDFGTTRTKVAYFDPDHREPRLIELGYEVRAVIPSLFYLPPDGPPLVGDSAQQMIDEDPEGVVVGLKKEIHKLGKYRCGGGRPSIDRRELAGHLFRYIREQCELEVFHGERVSECVLTVPVAFEDQKRECIREAARKGGFERIAMVDEPVAAARAWLAKAGQKVAQHVVVCDVGGGTTDFALLRHDRGRFESVPEVPPVGFSLGGNDVDEAILAQLLDNGAGDADAVEQRRGGFLVRLRQAREGFARSQQRTELGISLEGAALRVQRQAVLSCAAEFVGRVADELKRFLARCQAVPGVTDPPVLLVGGGSRMPGLKEAIEPLAPGRLFQWNQSDFAVVLGAVESPSQVPSDASSATVKPESLRRSDDKANTSARDQAQVPSSVLVAEVRAMVGDGKVEEAFRVVTDAVTAAPDERLLDLWADCSIAMVDSDMVLAVARDIHRRRSGDPWSSSCLVQALMLWGRNAEAKQILEPLLAAGHEEHFAVLYARHAIFDDMDKDAARPIREQLLHYLPDSPSLIAFKAMHLTDHPEQAEALIDAAYRIDPNNMWVLFAQAAAVIGSKSESSEEGASLIGSKLRHMERISAAHYLTGFVQAIYHMTCKNYEAMIEVLDQVSTRPQVKNSNGSMSLLLHLRSLGYQAVGKALEERRDVEQLVQHAPKDPDARAKRAWLLLRERKFAEAVADANLALIINPDHIVSLLARAWGLFLMGEREADAVKDFESVCRLQPGHVDARFGATCCLIGDYVRLALTQGQPMHCCYIFPSIPADKLANVIKAYAGSSLTEQSAIALLFDNTWFGGAENGFCISEEYFMTHNSWEQSVFRWRLADIRATTCQGNDIHVNGTRIECAVLGWKQHFCKMLDELAALHRRLDGYANR